MRYFMGSSADDNIGVGTLLIGTAARHQDTRFGGYELLVDGTWIPVFDIMIVTGSESPMEADLTPPQTET